MASNMRPNHNQAEESLQDLSLQSLQWLGMVSHKMSKIINLGHKRFYSKISLMNFIFFIRFSKLTLLLVHMNANPHNFKNDW